ncbi:MAG: ABC-ATPase UvrA, partial [Planctomycetota bacterium]
MVAAPIIAELTKRLQFLCDVGVQYLSLSRSAATLSGGELQRVRLATSIGTGLVGVCYVLDEPSIGLHSRDNDRLIESMRNLQRLGNTVVVVEHDEALMRAADWLIDMGPGAGVEGGNIVLADTPAKVQASPDSPTGKYLSGDYRVIPPRPDRDAPTDFVKLRGAAGNNLKKINVDFPLQRLVGVTGVSGSGKSTLVNDTLAPAIADALGQVAADPAPFGSIQGTESIDKLIPIDQSPIGRSPRSCPATHTGALDEIRKVFAATRDAKQLGFAANRFSFNSPAGRCPKCKGQGRERIEMQFLSDFYVICESCGGSRYEQQTLRCRFKDATISDVLSMTIATAAQFFENIPRLSRILNSVVAVGLGYLQLGQPSSTLSGGEAQRMKLAGELARPATGNTLYLLDEPTTGLHFADVRRLLEVLNRLVDAGNSVIVIEHHTDVISACDWIIDLGPEGGDNGGITVEAHERRPG